MFRVLVRRRSRQSAADDPGLATFRMNLGEVLRRLRRFDDAERMARLALDAVGRSTLESASAMIGLGRILADRGRAREGERLIEDGLALRRVRLGPDHPDVKRAEAQLAEIRQR